VAAEADRPPAGVHDEGQAMTRPDADPTDVSDDGLGPLLLRARRARSRSQQRVAEQLCAVAGTSTVSRHEMSRWERGERIPSPYWLAWLSVVLDLPVADLERAAAVTRDRRIRPTVSAPAPGGWPWRLIRAYAVVTADGGIHLLSGPPANGRRPVTPQSALARAITRPLAPTVTVAS
jgi:transcriptional regulator with XRE-family HTH domain